MSDEGFLPERFWPDGSLRWGHPVDVGHLILQLQTMDPTMKVSSVTFIDTAEGTKARACGLSISRERWDKTGWLDWNLKTPENLAIWATQRRLSWSKEVPTKPGWYFHNGPAVKMVPIHLVIGLVSLDLVESKTGFLAEDIPGEWAGPMEEPS